MMTTMPCAKPQSSFAVGQFGGYVTLISVEFGGMADSIVVCE